MKIEENNELVKICCDMCPREDESWWWKNSETGFVSGDFDDGSHKSFVTELEYTECTSTSYGTESYKLMYDICPECFRDKLLPWLKKQTVTNGKEVHEVYDE